MAREFKIKGDTTEEKFKYLNTVLPRIYRKLNPNVTTVLPSAFSSFHEDILVDEGFKALLFKGKIIKIAYNINRVEAEEKVEFLDLKVVVNKGQMEESVNIKSKRRADVISVAIEVNDGDMIRVVNNNSVISYHDITFSFLYIPDRTERVVEKVENFYEGI